MKQQNDLILNGIVIHHLTFTQAVEKIIDLARKQESQLVVTPNADHVVRLAEDSAFREVYAQAVLRLADGMPLIWASKWLKNPLPERVTGADLLPALCAQAAQANLDVYLLGAPPGVAQQAAAALQKRHPHLSVVGTYSPPLGFENNQEENEKIIQQINAVKPHILFVGLGSPKQEFWMAKYQKQLQVGVMLGIGAAIAFAAGTEKRAPQWMQRVGLEWLFRWGQDPKRLTKRYWGDLRFFYLVWQEKRRN